MNISNPRVNLKIYLSAMIYVDSYDVAQSVCNMRDEVPTPVQASLHNAGAMFIEGNIESRMNTILRAEESQLGDTFLAWEIPI